MYDVDLVEQLLGVRITDKIPEGYVGAQPHGELFSESGSRSVHHLGNGSRIWEKTNAEERAVMQREAGRAAQ